MIEPFEEINVVTNDPDVVYPTDVLMSKYCTEFSTDGMSIVEFNACLTYATYETLIAYLSLFFGLFLGFLIAKAVSDGWI